MDGYQKKVTMRNGGWGGNHGEVDFRSSSKALEVEIISRGGPKNREKTPLPDWV